MLGVLAAALAGYGVFLLYTAGVFGWKGLGFGPAPRGRSGLAALRRRVPSAGADQVRPAEVAVTSTVFAAFGGALAFALFGGVLPAAIAAAFAGALPLASRRNRRARRVAAARQAWPRLLEELRVLSGSLGRSVPQALFEVGRRAPAEMRPAFVAAEREWLLSTDFARTLDVLKEGLADPTADVVCETLIVAHEVGGTELGRRLADLADDRAADLSGRRDAEAKQAGVRFARTFVLLVPLGMALAGMSIGTGRAAYETPGGQVAVAAGFVAVAACWVWSGRLMRLPDQPRVFPAALGGEAPVAAAGGRRAGRAPRLTGAPPGRRVEAFLTGRAGR